MRAFCALAALLIAALATPAIAPAAAPATEEYELNLPSANGEGEGGSGDDQGGAIAPPTSTPPTAPGTETVPVTPETIDEGAGNGKRERTAAEQAEGGPFASPAPDRPKERFTTSGSGDGGFPALLLLLGAIAGTSIGVAVWRLRREGGRPGSGGGSTPADATSGTQST
ncbi:MAG: hypothetical protein ACRDK9_05065 [Solirubrobacterales bacterium]